MTTKMQNNTEDFKKYLLKRLIEPEFVELFLESAFESYEDDGDIEALLLAMRDVVYAQGGIGKLAGKLKINRQHLYDVLAGRHNPSVSSWYKIVRGLGFKVRLERDE